MQQLETIKLWLRLGSDSQEDRKAPNRGLKRIMSQLINIKKRYQKRPGKKCTTILTQLKTMSQVMTVTDAPLLCWSLEICSHFLVRFYSFYICFLLLAVFIGFGHYAMLQFTYLLFLV
jgi:DNA-binding FrmR family transcriptional regulator